MGLGKRLEQVISSRNLKIMQVASMSGVPASTLYSIIERDNKKIDIDILIRICKSLDIPVEYLVGDDSNNEVNYEYYEIEEKLKFVGCKLGFYEEDAYLWIEFPDGSLEITEKDLSELNKSTNDFLKFKLMELRSERPKDFRKKNK